MRNLVRLAKYSTTYQCTKLLEKADKIIALLKKFTAQPRTAAAGPSSVNKLARAYVRARVSCQAPGAIIAVAAAFLSRASELMPQPGALCSASVRRWRR